MPYPVGTPGAPVPAGPGAPMVDPLVPPVGVAVTQFTLRWFAGLPDFVEAADQATGWQLLRYLSLLGDQAAALEQLYERIDFTPLDEGGPPGDTSDLVDPDAADAAWLPWLAQAVGAHVSGLTEADRRAAIGSAAAGWQGGSKRSVAAAAQTVLTGSKSVAIYDHTTDTSGVGAGSQWDVLIVTRTEETPVSSADLIAAVVALGTKPAGVTLWHTPYTAAWSAIEAAYPTWAARDGLTWDQLVQTGL